MHATDRSSLKGLETVPLPRWVQQDRHQSGGGESCQLRPSPPTFGLAESGYGDTEGSVGGYYGSI